MWNSMIVYVYMCNKLTRYVFTVMYFLTLTAVLLHALARDATCAFHSRIIFPDSFSHVRGTCKTDGDPQLVTKVETRLETMALVVAFADVAGGLHHLSLFNPELWSQRKSRHCFDAVPVLMQECLVAAVHPVLPKGIQQFSVLVELRLVE